MRRGGEARKQEHGHERIAEHCNRQSSQAHQLKPMPRRGHFAARAERLTRQKIQATAFTEHVFLPGWLRAFDRARIREYAVGEWETTGLTCSETGSWTS